MSNPVYYISVSENNEANQNKSKEIIAEVAGPPPVTEPKPEAAAETTEVVSEAVLAEIDAAIAEEDPEFLKHIEQIQIDAAIVSLSIMDEAIASMDREVVRFKKLRLHLKNIFNIAANPKKVIILWLLVILSCAAIYFMSQILNRIFDDKLFIHSYNEIGTDLQTYNPISEAEPLYDNQRFAKNVVTMAKMLVNIKASESSTANPMLSMELNVEGTSAEAIIEIKDREAEYKDMILREAESFTYDQLDTAEGKREMLEKFKSSMNTSLTQGQVRRVLIRSFILKP